ncbi:MAG: hypothetical protein WBZ37_25775 [Mycobacterium sp.]
MSAAPLNSLTVDRFRLREPIAWRDPDIDCTLVISTPSAHPDLWAEYSVGAHLSYSKHGVECALDSDALRSGADTLVYFAVIDDAGKMVAGVRGIGPLQSAEDPHAVVEWAGQPGQQAVRGMINDRVPFGVVEMKSAWVTDESDQDRCLTHALARSAAHVTALLDDRVRTEPVAFVRRSGGEQSRDALPRRALPTQDHVVGPARFRESCNGTTTGCQNAHGDNAFHPTALPTV